MAVIDIHTHNRKSLHLAILQQIDPIQFEHNGYFSIGIHPAESNSNTFQLLDAMPAILSLSNCIALGEIGLDNRLEIDLTIQEMVFIEQLKLAQTFNLPILLHCVGAWDRCRFLHAQYAPNQFIVFHGFSKPSIVESVLEYEQSFISLGQTLLHSKALQLVIRDVPIERIFLETDTADVDLNLLYLQLAELKQLSLQLVIDQLWLNFKHVFNAHELA